MSNSIKHTWFYAHSSEEVWDYLTKAELIEQWLMKSDFMPVVGHQFQFHTKPLPQMDFDGNVYCTVMEVVPFQKLSYSWKGGPGNGVITLDSVVKWTLIPKEGGAELHLEHSGFKQMENSIMYMAMNEGWLRNIQRIDDLIKSRKNDTTNA